MLFFILLQQAAPVYKKSRAALLIGGFLFFISPQVHAQPEQQWILKERLDANKGDLPQNSILDLFFDKKTGFLWMTSEGGLVRYNGKRSFSFDNRNVQHLNTPRFFKFAKMINGKMIAVSRALEKFYIAGDSLTSAGEIQETSYRQFVLSFYNFPEGKSTLIRDTDSGFISTFPFAGRNVYWINNTDFIIGGNPGIYYVSSNLVKEKFIETGLTQFSFFELDQKLYAISAIGRAYEIEKAPFKVKRLNLDPVFLSKNIKFFFNSHSNFPAMMKGDSLFMISVSDDRISAKLLAVLPLRIPDITTIAINSNNREIYCGSATNGLYIFSKSNFYTYFVPEEFINKNLKIENPSHGFNNIYSTMVLGANKFALTNEGILFNLNDGSFVQSLNQNEESFKQLANLRDGNFERPLSLNLHYSTNYKIDKHSFFWRVNPRDLFNLRMNFTSTGHFIMTKVPIKEMYHFSQASDGTIWACSGNSFGIYSNDSVRKLSSMSWLPDSLKKTDLLPLDVIGPVGKHSFLAVLGKHLFSIDTSTFTLKKLGSPPDITYRSFVLRNNRYCWISTYAMAFFF